MARYLIKNDDIINILLNIFFITAFFTATYTNNIFVIFSLALSLTILLNCFNSDKSSRTSISYYFVFAFFIILSFVYYLVGDFRDSFRVIKTMSILLPILFIPPNINIRVSKVLHYFLVLNALLVYIDFLLYYVAGITITDTELSGIFLRLGGLMEDSNFYSFSIVCYIQYLYIKTNRYNKLFIISVFLSVSFSAILLLFSIFIFNLLAKRFNKKVSSFSVVLSLSLFIAYYSSVILMPNLRDTFAVDSSLNVKFISLSLRFESQYQALMSTEYIFGIGAGRTTSYTDIGLNLHNSYLQIFLEMGSFLLLPILLLIFTYYRKIDSKFVPLFMMILFLGNILEVIYFPIISFILFLSLSYSNEYHIASQSKFL